MSNAAHAAENDVERPTRATIWREYWPNFDEHADISCPIISIGVSPAGVTVYTILHEASGEYHVLEDGELALVNVF